MEHLQCKRNTDNLIVYLSYRACSQHHKHRTNLLSGCFHEVFHCLLQHNIVAAKRLPEYFVELFHFGRNRCLDLFQYLHLYNL